MPHNKRHTPSRPRKTSPAEAVRRTRAMQMFAASLFALHVAPAAAVELGDLRVHSWLGRQIKASIALAGDDAGSSEARCFKGVLVNLQGEPVSALKLGLQQTTAGPVLLLFGGSAVDEPAAMVVVENLCGTGDSRDYAVLLDRVPASQEATTPQTLSPTPAPTPKPVADTNVNERIWIPDTVYPVPGMPPMRMASMLGAQDDAPIRRASLRDTGQEERFSSAQLRLDRAEGKFASARNGKAATTMAWPTGVLFALLVLGAAAWIGYRIRAMRAAAKPWLPTDAHIDADAADGQAKEREPS